MRGQTVVRRIGRLESGTPETPEEIWNAREPITIEERARLKTVYVRYEQEERARRALDRARVEMRRDLRIEGLGHAGDLLGLQQPADAPQRQTMRRHFHRGLARASTAEAS